MQTTPNPQDKRCKQMYEWHINIPYIFLIKIDINCSIWINITQDMNLVRDCKKKRNRNRQKEEQARSGR